MLTEPLANVQNSRTKGAVGQSLSGLTSVCSSRVGTGYHGSTEGWEGVPWVYQGLEGVPHGSTQGWDGAPWVYQVWEGGTHGSTRVGTGEPKVWRGGGIHGSTKGWEEGTTGCTQGWDRVPRVYQG